MLLAVLECLYPPSHHWPWLGPGLYLAGLLEVLGFESLLAVQLGLANVLSHHIGAEWHHPCQQDSTWQLQETGEIELRADSVVGSDVLLVLTQMKKVEWLRAAESMEEMVEKWLLHNPWKLGLMLEGANPNELLLKSWCAKFWKQMNEILKMKEWESIANETWVSIYT
jgi:hypothetical protein